MDLPPSDGTSCGCGVPTRENYAGSGISGSLEGMQLRPVTSLPLRLFQRGREVGPGVLLCVVLACVGVVVGTVVPVIGSVIPALVLGVGTAAFRTPHARLRPGIVYSGRFLLQCAVVLLGAKLSVDVVLDVGAASLPVMLSSLGICLLGAWVLGRVFAVERDLTILLGVGTGICGASAIAAVAPVIRAKSADVSYAVSTVFLFNVVAVLAFPALGHAFGMSPHAFGLFAGTAVNDTSSVVAAASAYSAASLGFAVVVKLVRTLMIIPITVVLAVAEGRRSGRGERLTANRVLRLVPWFLVGFLLLAGANSLGLVSPQCAAALSDVSVFLIGVAIAGIGLSTDLRAIRAAGVKPLLCGGLLSLLVLGTTLLVMALTGNFGI